MAVLKCSVCGGYLNDTDKENVYVCGWCGLRQTFTAPPPDQHFSVVNNVFLAPDRSPEVNVLLQRIFILLKDEQWRAAITRCDTILDMDPTCAEAYLARAMAMEEISLRHQVWDPAKQKELRFNRDYQHAIEYGLDVDAGRKEYKKVYDQRKAISKEEREIARRKRCLAVYKPAVATLEKARAATVITEKRDLYREAKGMFDKIPDFEDAKALLAECAKALEEITPQQIKAYEQNKQNEEMYARAVANMEEGSVRSLEKAIERFGKLPGYQDSDQRLAQCKEQLDILLAPIRAEQETMERQAAEEAEKRRQMEAWQAACRQNRRCQHCGGTFKGFWTSTCTNCGRKKDY